MIRGKAAMSKTVKEIEKDILWTVDNNCTFVSDFPKGYSKTIDKLVKEKRLIRMKISFPDSSETFLFPKGTSFTFG